MARRIYKTDNTEKLAFAAAVGALGLRAIAYGQRALGALVKSGVCVTHLDGDAPSQLFAMGAGPDAGDCLNQSSLAMVYVP